jgi:hypothetical protein
MRWPHWMPFGFYRITLALGSSFAILAVHAKAFKSGQAVNKMAANLIDVISANYRKTRSQIARRIRQVWTIMLVDLIC